MIPKLGRSMHERVKFLLTRVEKTVGRTGGGRTGGGEL